MLTLADIVARQDELWDSYLLAALQFGDDEEAIFKAVTANFPSENRDQVVAILDFLCEGVRRKAH